MMRSPLIPEVGVLALPYHPWDSIWMTPHYVLPRLAEYFHVVWLDAPPHWRSVLGGGSGESRESKPVDSQEAVSAGFHVYRPGIPDLYRFESLRRALMRQRVRLAWKMLDRLGCTTRVLHIWHPRFGAAMRAGNYDLSLYHIDDEYSFSAEEDAAHAAEQDLLEAVDHVITISPSLLERKGQFNENITLVPEGVDADLYATPVDCPADLAAVPGPVIGYTGNLKRWLDWPLIGELARSRPDWSFVFVGPRRPVPGHEALIDEISGYDNVFMLGEKRAIDLPAYVQHFDVCTMPYCVNPYTNNIFPLKLHEYLATGRPVVGTPIRSLLDFTDVIATASGASEWVSAIERSLKTPITDAAAAQNRQAVAREYDWEYLVRKLALTICHRLDGQLEPSDGRFAKVLQGNRELT